jgi:hypothetical protein
MLQKLLEIRRNIFLQLQPTSQPANSPPARSSPTLLPFAFAVKSITCPQLSASVHIRKTHPFEIDADDLQLILFSCNSWLIPFLKFEWLAPSAARNC